MLISSDGEFTEAEKATVQKEVDRIIAKALRCDVAFMPLALEIMNYEIILTGKALRNEFNPPPAMTDFSRIWIDVKHEFFTTCMDAGMSFSQVLCTLLFHEVGHPLLYHQKRIGHRDPAVWNSAGDFVINLLLSNLENESSRHTQNKLVDLNIRRIPQDNILLSDSYEGMVEEEIYCDLVNKETNRKTYYVSVGDFEKMMDQNGLGGGQSDSDEDGDEEGDNQGDQGQGGEDEGKGKGKPKISQDPHDIDGPPVKITEIEFEVDGQTHKSTHIEFPKPAPGSAKEEEQQKKRERNVQMNRKNFENTLMKGVGSENLKQFLGKLFKVPIDWEKILKDSLLTALQPSTDQVWHKPRTIWLLNAVRGMPYLPNNDDEEVRGIAFFSIDESGSMGNDDIKKAISIVKDADEHYKSLCIMKHDDGVSKIYHYNEENLLDDDAIEELCTRQRCGGTSHKDVFRQINKFLKENPEEMASVYIGCTDLYSDIEQCQDDIDGSIPRIWLVNSDYSPNGLIGRVIRLK
jgi:predicted metal-dependent peptidase